MIRLWEKILFFWLLGAMLTMIMFPQYRSVVASMSIYPMMVGLWFFMVGILIGLFPYFVICSASKIRPTTMGACASVIIGGSTALILAWLLVR